MVKHGHAKSQVELSRRGVMFDFLVFNADTNIKKAQWVVRGRYNTNANKGIFGKRLTDISGTSLTTIDCEK